MYLLIILALFTILFIFIQNITKHNTTKHPPGPPRLPIIGNLHQLSSAAPHIRLHQLSTTYGPLMSLKLGSIPALVVSSAKFAELVLKTQDHDFCSRPSLVAIQKLSYKGLDVAFSPYNDSWRQVRKLFVMTLFSSNKVKSSAWMREEEVREMVKKISQFCAEGVSVDLSELIMSLTNKVICRIAFGRRSDGSHVRCRELLKDAQEMFSAFFFSDYFPCMGWADKLTGKSARLHRVFMELDRFHDQIIDEHVKRDRPESVEEDTVDVLLRLKGDKSCGIDITTDHIKAALMDIFVGGTDTSAATLVLAMTELMRNPEAMKQVQHEARTILMGKHMGDGIKEEDVEKMLYLKAVVKETLRLHPVVPLLIPHETTQKSSIQGHEIQEKTLVYVNVWAIGRDSESWENPEEFKPERFLGNNPIDLNGQHFELIPFGSGRRICPALQLAVSIVELALASLVYEFDWTVPEGMEEQVMDTSVLTGIATHKKHPLCLMPKIPR